MFSVSKPQCLDSFAVSSASDSAIALLKFLWRLIDVGVSLQVTTHTSLQRILHGIKVISPGLLPLSLALSPVGSSKIDTLMVVREGRMMSFSAVCLEKRSAFY